MRPTRQRPETETEDRERWVWWQKVKARHARIRVAQAAKAVDELADTVAPNWMEQQLLRPQRPARRTRP